MNSYTKFGSCVALSDDYIRRVAPSVFASDAHESRSSRYTYIPTAFVLQALRSEGFLPVKASQSRARDSARREFTKHVLRFQRDNTRAIVGDVVPEVIMVNSHDGTSAYEISCGMYRFVCANGMAVCENKAAVVKVAHKGDIKQQVIDASYTVIEQAGEIARNVQDWKSIQLSRPEQEAFARAALPLRFDTEDKAPPITPAQALIPRRQEDHAKDLWTTFNVVQENLVKGGTSYFSKNDRYNRTREIKSIDKDLRLNRSLWQLAEEMKRLKS